MNPMSDVRNLAPSEHHPGASTCKGEGLYDESRALTVARAPSAAGGRDPKKPPPKRTPPHYAQGG
eukprot:2985717-Pleurochrysis_carterae.AAC.1